MSEIPEMVEKAARAAYSRTQGSVSDERWREIWAWHTDPYTTSRGGPWYLLQCVEATIEAIREPTEAMLGALDVDEHRYGRGVWYKMIDVLRGKARWSADTSTRSS